MQTPDSLGSRADTHYVYDDGGRRAAGFKGSTGDCVCRAIAIAGGYSYRGVYDLLNTYARRSFVRRGGEVSNARTGVQKPDIRGFLSSLGWAWTPTMFVGQGCKVHLRASELPRGRLIVCVSKHLCAVIDGVVHDTYDPSRRGTRCVYGYWTAPVSGPLSPIEDKL